MHVKTAGQEAPGGAQAKQARGADGMGEDKYLGSQCSKNGAGNGGICRLS